MLVNSIKKISKTKYLIHLDNDISFPLYLAEVKKLGLEEGGEIDEKTYNLILDEILYKRALSRCNHLIADSPRTRFQLEVSLRNSNYPDVVITDVINKLVDLNYINDQRYCEDYINYYKNQKGFNAIKINLIKRGISKDILDNYLEEIDEDSQIESLDRLIRHKIDKNKDYSYDELNKIKAFLIRKGYSISLINKEIAIYLEDDN